MCDYDPTLDEFGQKIVQITQLEDIDNGEDYPVDYTDEETDDEDQEYYEAEPEDDNDDDIDEMNEEGSGQNRRSLWSRSSRRIRNYNTHKRGRRQVSAIVNTPYLEWEYEGQCSTSCGAGIVKQVRKCKDHCDPYS